MEGSACVHRDIIVTRHGVGAQPSITPATIVPARYHGTYEGAPWICFPVHDQRLTEPRWRNWGGNERDCQAFWQSPHIQKLMIGRGNNPTAAYDNLIDQACAHVPASTAPPSPENQTTPCPWLPASPTRTPPNACATPDTNPPRPQHLAHQPSQAPPPCTRR